MKINAQELNGLFQAEYHSLSNRFLWITFASISLLVMVFGVWAIRIRLFELSTNPGLKSFEILSAILLFLIIPIAIFTLGLIHFFKKPGIYFSGARITDTGIETGKFFLAANSFPPKTIRDREMIAVDKMGEWKKIKRFNENTLDIRFILSKRQKFAEPFLLEQVVFSSRAKCLSKLFGHDRSGVHRNNIFAVSQGSLHLLGSDEGIHPGDLPAFRERAASIFSRWQTPLILSCTLKTISSLAPLNGVLAFGVLGGINIPGPKSGTHKESQKIIFDSLTFKKHGRLNADACNLTDKKYKINNS